MAATSQNPSMVVKFKEFAGRWSWEKLYEMAAEFATTIGKDRLIGITQSYDRYNVMVVVWYWQAVSRRSRS